MTVNLETCFNDTERKDNDLCMSCAPKRRHYEQNALCGLCADGYRVSGDGCTICDSANYLMIFGAAISCIGLAMGIQHISRYRSRSLTSDAFGIFMYNVQMAKVYLGPYDEWASWMFYLDFNVAQIFTSDLGKQRALLPSCLEFTDNSLQYMEALNMGNSILDHNPQA